MNKPKPHQRLTTRHNHSPVIHKKSAHVLPKSKDDQGVYRRFFSGSGDPVLVLDLKLKIDYANPAAEKFFNFPSANSSGKFFKDCVTADSLHKLNAAVKRVSKDLMQIRLELDAVDGHRERVTSEVTVAPVIEGTAVVAFRITIRDVRQERQIEELIRESQKMEAIQYFVTGTTKELKYPLLAILKRIESIESKYKGRSFEYVSFKEFTQIMNFLQSMHKQIKYCYDTTSKLTNLNKKRLKFESKDCQANDVIREVLRLKTNHLKMVNVKFRLRLSEKLPLVEIGEIELNQIISNIIDNSVQAMPAGGNLTIVTSVHQESHRVRIDLIDDGVGISPEDLPHIFEPFFTTKQRGIERNAGLGLSIVYSLVKAADGQIHVNSSLRKGTTVHVTFPIVKNSPSINIHHK